MDYAQQYIVVNVFGKQLNSMAKVREHYEANQDFLIQSVVHGPGRHINKSDIAKYSPGAKLEVRYGRNGEKVMII